MGYVPTIGLEVHVQLNTKSKLFSTASCGFGGEPNSQTTAVCLGLPGALPVLNKEAVRKAVKAALALSGTINPKSRFDRKNYFYPDLPKGYQISQYFEPFCTGAKIEIDTPNGRKVIGISRIHLEEDAGKLLHSENPAIAESYVDFNRAGTPLIEIVSKPEMDSPDEAVAYLTKLKSIMEYIEVSDCDMEKGSLRVDANVSLRREGEVRLGTRVEIKNLNSFKALKAAIEYEIERQREILESGGSVVQETRLFNPTLGKTIGMRTKEEAHDYRYFPDPDLVPLILSEEEIESWRQELPELAEQKKERFIKEFSLPEYDAQVLTAQKAVADYFEAVVKAGAPAKKASNWVMVEMLALTQKGHLSVWDLFPPEYLAQLIQEIEKGNISGKIGKTVFELMVTEKKNPREIIQERNLAQISDTEYIGKIIDEVLLENPSAVADFKSGKERALKHLQGEIMKKSKGRVNPVLTNEILLKKLQG
ncbi:MAG: Asp-tRNA(Asn)/Glu-tRNA(Gln) amidotransferase subunit GatB [Leptospiraceae bacterium]|nr:Asp-tRNA(Asn)/Glu-tRNA(Gln) amidotransferase subunit GatB [Leptospiraceae bacterium]MDW8305920.1 Asp-tRNA(Asn)/Glu-tRNA(Gln) amidotransferase subunit GatB [Leptospiraceae bacterium]